MQVFGWGQPGDALPSQVPSRTSCCWAKVKHTLVELRWTNGMNGIFFFFSAVLSMTLWTDACSKHVFLSNSEYNVFITSSSSSSSSNIPVTPRRMLLHILIWLYSTMNQLNDSFSCLAADWAIHDCSHSRASSVIHKPVRHWNHLFICVAFRQLPCFALFCFPDWS